MMMSSLNDDVIPSNARDLLSRSAGHGYSNFASPSPDTDKLLTNLFVHLFIESLYRVVWDVHTPLQVTRNFTKNHANLERKYVVERTVDSARPPQVPYSILHETLFCARLYS